MIAKGGRSEQHGELWNELLVESGTNKFLVVLWRLERGAGWHICNIVPTIEQLRNVSVTVALQNSSFVFWEELESKDSQESRDVAVPETT